MTVKTIFADKRGMVFLLCPFCGENSMKPVTLFPIHQPVSISCTCGKVYEFQIENRKKFRKKTVLKGYYVKQDADDDYSAMTVIDLTLHGCCLLTTDKHTLNVCDSIRVIFKLDNPKRTEIKKYATVRWIMGNKIGCQLTTNHFEPELGFYAEDFKVQK